MRVVRVSLSTILFSTLYVLGLQAGNTGLTDAAKKPTFASLFTGVDPRGKADTSSKASPSVAKISKAVAKGGLVGVQVCVITYWFLLSSYYLIYTLFVYYL